MSRTITAWGAVALSLVLHSVAMAGSDTSKPNETRPPAGAIRVKADIDGRSQLHLRDDTVSWYHMDYAAPGREAGLNLPTFINDAEWQPVWPKQGRNDSARCFSSKFRELVPPLPLAPIDVGLWVWRARGTVTIGQQPRAENDFTLIVDFNDNADGGSDWYGVTIVWPRTQMRWPDTSSATVALHIALVDVQLPREGPRRVDISPEALGLEPASVIQPVGVPPGVKYPVTLARVPSLRDFLDALNGQGIANLVAEKRMTVALGSSARAAVEGANPGDIHAGIESTVKAVHGEKGLVDLTVLVRAERIRQDLEPDDPGSMIRWPRRRAGMANEITNFVIPSGATAISRMDTSYEDTGGLEALMLVTANIIACGK